jgi:alkylation response protein AidB-like acyl-CoA dehydrogenase
MGYADRQELFLEEAEAWTAGTEQSGEKGVLVRQQLAQMAINTEVSKLLRYRSTWEQAQGITGTASGPMTKAFSAVKYLQDARAWMDLQGPLAALERGAQQAPLQGAFAETYRAAPVTTIYGGTVEILRSVIAEVGLGLPKSR